MTDLLDQALEVARKLPPETRDDLARLVLSIAGEDEPPMQLTPEEEASFAESLAQAARGEFATEEQVRAVLAKYGLRSFATRRGP